MMNDFSLEDFSIISNSLKDSLLCDLDLLPDWDFDKHFLDFISCKFSLMIYFMEVYLDVKQKTGEKCSEG